MPWKIVIACYQIVEKAFYALGLMEVVICVEYMINTGLNIVNIFCVIPRNSPANFLKRDPQGYAKN